MNMPKQMEPFALPFILAATAVGTIVPVRSAFVLSVHGWKSRQRAIARLDEDETR
jgi:hypothetical protein